jgi:dTDP-4-dehydrorhamnose 3,5-epimerase
VEIASLKLSGTYLISSPRRTDERGYFMRSYDRAAFADMGLVTEWEQESLSFNREAGTIRGLHFQTPPAVESKIVRVVAGGILDVFVDLRRGSATYGQWDSITLSSKEGDAVYIAAGFAHGFRTLEPETLIAYKIDVPYSPDYAAGLRWDDPDLNIDWGLSDPAISGRDAKLPYFRDFNSPFVLDQ